MLDELVVLFVDRTAKEGSFFFWRDDVVDVLVEPGIEGIAEFAVQRLLAFFAVFRSLEKGLSGNAERKQRTREERKNRMAPPRRNLGSERWGRGGGLLDGKRELKFKVKS